MGDLMFIVPEQRLPAFCEDPRDCHLVMFDQHLIRIVKGETELFGEKFPDSVFPLLVKPHKIIGCSGVMSGSSRKVC